MHTIEITLAKYTPPFRVGKKQSRAVLDALGHEVVVFKIGDENLACLFVKMLNEAYPV